MREIIRLFNLLCIVLFFAPAAYLMCQPDFPGGVKITGNYDPDLKFISDNQKSEIILEEQGLLNTESLFRIEFKFSLYNTLSRGSFIKFSSGGKFKAEISHLPQLDKDTSYIRFQIETDKTYITDFPLLKKVQSVNNWNSLSVVIDFLMQKALFKLNYETTERRILLPLGEKRITLFNPETDPNRDLPDFCMRELKIVTDNESLFFPFTERSGSRATDFNNGIQLRLRNIEWLYPRFSDGVITKSKTNYPASVPLTTFLTGDGLLLYETTTGRAVFDPSDLSFSAPHTMPVLFDDHAISTELNFEENTLYILNSNERYRIKISELDENIRPDLGSFNKKNIGYDEKNGMIYGAFLGYDKSVASLEKIEYYLLVYSYSIHENKFRLAAKRKMHILDYNNTVMIPRFDRNELHFVSFSDSGGPASLSEFTQYILLLSRNKPEPATAYIDLFAGIKWYYFLFAGAAAALTFSVFYRKKMKSARKLRFRNFRSDNKSGLVNTFQNSAGGLIRFSEAAGVNMSPGIPVIQMFGKFEISDVYGNIITDRITGKRREILLYMLSKSQLQNASLFTPAELKTVFFSELTDEKFTKNLKVHLSNLRNNLKSIEIRILKNDGLVLSQETVFDLIQINNLCDRFEHGMFSPHDAKIMCDILGKGKFLAGEKISGNWFRSICDEINLKALSLITGVISEYGAAYDSNLKLRLAHVLSVHAPLSEESLNLKISVYLQTGNTEAIRSVYAEFARNYRMLTGEKYQKELRTILRGK